MRLIQRYLFRQLLGPTLLAIAALTAVAVLSQSLSALDILVDQRQSPLVFAKITLLAMPQLVVMILPVAVLIAGLIALNRLHTEQEIVICFAGGMSRWRVVSPAFRLAALISLVTLVLTLWIQPLSYRAMRKTLQAARTDLAATMVKPGQFTHPAPGLTVYAQAMDDDGAIHNLFINQSNGHGRDVTVTAREGRIIKRNGVPMLVMKNGANQEVSKAGVLNFLSFDEYDFDLRPLMAVDQTVHYKLSDRYLHELFFPDFRQDWERANRKKLFAEGHGRLAAPLYSIAFMAAAAAAVLGGSFSRLGYGTRIAGAAVAALVVRTLGFAAQAAAGGTPAFNALQYLLPLGMTLACALVLFAPPRRTPRPAATAPALAGGRA
ncbi:MAG TPA: LPS export ABC transporter permease LptF [Caulobacteraceae bacterium]|nr:LPS export ABC transporter permease LptF [Caulobacteraceae bacterium]